PSPLKTFLLNHWAPGVFRLAKTNIVTIMGAATAASISNSTTGLPSSFSSKIPAITARTWLMVSNAGPGFSFDMFGVVTCVASSHTAYRFVGRLLAQQKRFKKQDQRGR